MSRPDPVGQVGTVEIAYEDCGLRQTKLFDDVLANLLLLQAWTDLGRHVNLRLWRTPDALIWALIVIGFAMFVPSAAIAVARAPRKAWPAILLVACALASPAAHWMRYALALPIALLAGTSLGGVGGGETGAAHCQRLAV